MKIKILILLMLSGMIVQGQNTNLAVIANPGGAPAGLKQTELNAIFMGETPKWSNGSKIVLALMKTNTTAGKLTCDKVYHMSGDELTKFWLSQMIDGKVAAPTFFKYGSRPADFCFRKYFFQKKIITFHFSTKNGSCHVHYT
ncbi:MAG: hypothetical protein IPO53_07255 [Chitinophagaceae bacterium]|nr:hypothetical protein [Chitinophagaceae bacterium]